MRGLVPRDLWEHGIGDLLRSLALATGPGGEETALDLHEIGKCIPLRSGRAALVTAIRTLNVPPGTPIAVPLYCCPVVFKAIGLAGCRPRFIDIDPETLCMSPDDLSAKSSRIEAVIAVHMFGNLCEVDRLREEARGKPVIEDCAQALASRSKDRPAGSFGDLAFFSFRSGKNISAGEGGALYSNDARLFSRASQLVSMMPIPRRTEEYRHAVNVYIKSLFRSRPLYGVAGYRLWQFLEKRMKLSESSSVALGRIHRTDLALVKKRLASLGFSVARQRAHASFFARVLEPEPATTCPEKPGMFYNRFHFPLIFRSAEQRDFVAAHLLRRRIDTMKYLNGLVEIASRYHGYDGGCPVAERMAEKVLILPSYHTLDEKDVQHIASCTNDALAKIRSRGCRDTGDNP